jgi:hypothetical protein
MFAQGKGTGPAPLTIEHGRLVYTPDSLGNRIPDFSYCGFAAGEKPIPAVPARVVVPLQKGDATAWIQHALDYVSALPADDNGFRGAVLLQKGTYEVQGALKINASGVVLRGSGYDAGGTILLGAGKDRQTLLQVAGQNNRVTGKSISITDDYVPVNARVLHVSDGHGLNTGDKVIVHRPSTAAWIEALGAGHFGGGITALAWKPGQRDLYWDATITSVNGNAIELDIPLTTALDRRYGGGTITPYQWRGRISNVGIENMQLVSTYDKANAKDEAHRWMAITIDNAADVWVRQIVFSHFAGSAVFVNETAKRITVQDCKSLSPVSEIGGERRNSFFTAGQQTLFQHCYAEYGMHDFATGFCAPGPNAFVQCESYRPYGFSGAIDSWASGILFDDVRIDGRPLSLFNRGQDGNGAGWSAANSVLWNCSAARIDCYKPPTAQNWSFGSWAQFSGDGYWAESNNHLEPRSLYYAQLAFRLGTEYKNYLPQLFIIETNPTSSPTVEQARELTDIAKDPQPTLSEFIDDAKKRHPISIETKGVKLAARPSENPQPEMSLSFEMKNGWLQNDGEVLTGSRISVPWWNGSARRYALFKARPAVTRYVPGKTGIGLTDNLEAVVDSMVSDHTVMLEQNYGLWYDRRRDDHERVRRADGDVWTPFYELPFARSGRDTAWDGLSKYDLTQYNHWYWKRLSDFADLAGKQGLLLLYQNYFQHNIIEAGAHYADFPWRTANNINHTGMPEPPPYAGDKRIFLAEQFYDTTHAVRRQLHKKFIRQCLGNFASSSNVIHTIGEEFTGPLAFVQFWLNTVKEWEHEKKKHPLIALSTTKDVQDAILSNRRYADVVDVIDIRYWHYQADGSVYAPKGGQNLAPRQHARLLKPKSSSFEQVYRAVSEYRKKYPNKAVIYSGDGADRYGWAVFMAGGSLANIPVMPAEFLKDAATMNEIVDAGKGVYELKKEDGYISYYENGSPVSVSAAPGKEGYRSVIKWFDARSGKQIGHADTLTRGKDASLKKSPASGPVILWVKRIPENKTAQLVVSPNGRFFMTADGKPFFWLGDTGWLLFSKLDRAEAIHYLDDRQRKGFNVIQAMLLHSLSVTNAYGDSALIHHNVSTPRTTRGYDYWDHIDYIVDAAAERGIYIAMVPVWGGNVKAGHVSVEEAKQYAAFLADRYKHKPNIIWLNGGDVKGSDHTEVWKTIGETLHAIDKDHLQSFHPFGRTTSSIWFHNEPWLQFNMFQSGHRTYAQDTSAGELHFGEDNWKYVQMNLAKTPAKPTLDGEPSYENIPHGLHDPSQPLWTDDDLRRYAYWSVFAGGCGFTYGNNAVMQMHFYDDPNASYGVKDAWYHAIEDPGAGQMQYLKKLMLSRSYFDRVPDQSLIAGDEGERYNRLLATRGERYALIYTYTGRNMAVNMGKIAGAKLKASWYDPRTGKYINIGTYDNKGTVTFNPPGEPRSGNDWVLVLDSIEK